jgi:endogenous inhibitor of DNA gyrase (YacG/DUF329 family)
MPRCPICKNRLPEPPSDASGARSTSASFPFCSERCKLVDLGNWLGEGYRIPAGEPEIDEAELHDPRGS